MRPNLGRAFRVLSWMASAIMIISCGQQDPERSVLLNRFAVLSVAEAPEFSFGFINVGESATQIFNITNTGQAKATNVASSLRISAFRYTGGSFPGIDGTCNSEIQIAETCTVSITFNPTYAAHFEEIVRINYFNGLRQTATDGEATGGRITIKGDGVNPPSP